VFSYFIFYNMAPKGVLLFLALKIDYRKPVVSSALKGCYWGGFFLLFVTTVTTFIFVSVFQSKSEVVHGKTFTNHQHQHPTMNNIYFRSHLL